MKPFKYDIVLRWDGGRVILLLLYATVFTHVHVMNNALKPNFDL
jgi:hypothetical protein